MKQEIEDKLERLEERVSRLKRYSDLKPEELETDITKRNAIERDFQVALEVVLDICSMIISYEGMEKPDEYRKMISALGDESILPAEFSERFEGAAGFRNVLVHQYTEVETDLLYENLTENLSDFDLFAREIASYAEELED